MRNRVFITAAIGIMMFSPLFLGCTQEEDTTTKISRTQSAKEVTVFDLSEDKAELEFTKIGNVSADSVVYVTPEATGRIVAVSTKVGEEVKKGDILVTLGDSLSTDIAEIQANAATESLYQTYNITNKTIEVAELNVQLAQDSYLNALANKRNAEDAYKEQRRSAEITVDQTEDSVEPLEDLVDDLEDAIDDIEDEIDDLEDDLDDVEEELEDDPTNPDLLAKKGALEDTIDDLEDLEEEYDDQLDTAEDQLETAEDGIEQTEIALNLVDINYQSQLDSLNYAIEASAIQLELAVDQLDSAQSSARLQEIQAESGQETAQLSANAAEVKAPMDGIVTAISAEIGNLTQAGQTLVTIENSEKLVVKTSINSYEAELLEAGGKVNITTDSDEMVNGEILSISPSANAQTKKIDVEIEVNNTDKITPESFVKIYFLPETNDRIFIPLNSINIEEDQKVVKIVDSKNHVKKIAVETGNIVGNYIEILDGVNGNELIIEASTAFITEGDKVKIK